MTRDETVIAETQTWLERVVIGLYLCPFANAVHKNGLVRYSVSHARTPEQLLEDLLHELVTLSVADPQVTDTTLLIHPDSLPDFLDYNDFLGVAEAALEDLGLSGELQIASFHPHYQFDGNTLDDPANYSNRSPYPMLHVLREASVERALAAFPDASTIFVKNRQTLRALGADRLRLLLVNAAETTQEGRPALKRERT